MKKPQNNKISKNLKIAHFGQKNCMTTEGGVEVVVAELAKRQAVMGRNVTCYNRSGHHISGAQFDAVKVKQWEGIRMKYVPTIQGKGLAAVSSSFFATLACAFGNYDIVHIHAEGPAVFIGLLRLSKIFNKKLRIIWTCHGIDWQRSKWKNGIGSKVIKAGEKNAVRYADEIIVLSDNIRNYFKTTYNRETHYIPNGVNRQEAKEADLITKEYGLKKNSYFLYLSRIVPEKRADLLIEAFKQVKTDKRLVIAGGMSDSEGYFMELKRKAADDERIIFTGFAEGEKKKELYSNAYVYVLPSDLEGMPLCLLEAMSYNNCCLVSDIPECQNVVNEEGICFEKGNEKDLTDKLKFVLENEQFVDNISADSADYICERYNWMKIVEEVQKVYTEIIG